MSREVIIPMRPGRLRRRFWALTALAVLIATGIGWASDVHADGYLSAEETTFVTQFGPTAVCPVIDKYPTVGGVMGVVAGVMDQGFTADNAVDVVNASVAVYCPQYFPLLQRVGAQARGEKQWLS